MSYGLGVWHSAKAISQTEAAELYAKLCEETWVPSGHHIDLYTFYDQLTSRYPEVEAVSDDDLDSCPWACTSERSGAHVILWMRPEKSAEVLPEILRLAENYGLVCFDPQASKLYLPSHLQPTASAERVGTLDIDWVNPGEQLPRYHIDFDDNGSSSAPRKTGEIFGERSLRDFLTADVGVDPTTVDSVLKKLGARGNTSIRDIALSDLKLMVLGLR